MLTISIVDRSVCEQFPAFPLRSTRTAHLKVILAVEKILRSPSHTDRPCVPCGAVRFTEPSNSLSSITQNITHNFSNLMSHLSSNFIASNANIIVVPYIFRWRRFEGTSSFIEGCKGQGFRTSGKRKFCSKVFQPGSSGNWPLWISKFPNIVRETWFWWSRMASNTHKMYDHLMVTRRVISCWKSWLSESHWNRGGQWPTPHSHFPLISYHLCNRRTFPFASSSFFIFFRIDIPHDPSQIRSPLVSVNQDDLLEQLLNAPVNTIFGVCWCLLDE